MGNCVSARAGLGEVSIAAEDSDFDTSSTQEEDDADSRNTNTVPVLSFFPVAGTSSETTSSTTGGTIQNSHQNRNCVIEVHDGANTHTLLVSGLPMVQVSPSLTNVTPRASTKSAITLDDDPQQKHHQSSSLLLLPPPHTDDTSSSDSRTSPMMEPRAPSDPSPPSMASFHASGHLRRSVTGAALSSSSVGGGGGAGAIATSTTTVTTVADPKMCQSVLSSWNESGQDAPPLFGGSGHDAWVAAAVAEMGLRHPPE